MRWETTRIVLCVVPIDTSVLPTDESPQYSPLRKNMTEVEGPDEHLSIRPVQSTGKDAGKFKRFAFTISSTWQSQRAPTNLTPW